MVMVPGPSMPNLISRLTTSKAPDTTLEQDTTSLRRQHKAMARLNTVPRQDTPPAGAPHTHLRPRIRMAAKPRRLATAPTTVVVTSPLPTRTTTNKVPDTPLSPLSRTFPSSNSSRAKEEEALAEAVVPRPTSRTARPDPETRPRTGRTLLNLDRPVAVRLYPPVHLRQAAVEDLVPVAQAASLPPRGLVLMAQEGLAREAQQASHLAPRPPAEDLPRAMEVAWQGRWAVAAAVAVVGPWANPAFLAWASTTPAVAVRCVAVWVGAVAHRCAAA